MTVKDTLFNKIKTGSFYCTFCRYCNIFTWPPSNYCKKCFKETKFKKINNHGILLELSYSHMPNQECFFGIGDFSGIRIIGTLVDKNMNVNDLIKINKATVINDKILLEFIKLSNKNE
jgi:uncharacterized OB-fold protein